MELEASEHIANQFVGIDPVSIEHNSCTPYGNNKQKLSTGSQHPGQLGCCFQVASRIQRVAISPQPDMFDYMHTGYRRQLTITERKPAQVGCAGTKAEAIATKYSDEPKSMWTLGLLCARTRAAHAVCRT